MNAAGCSWRVTTSSISDCRNDSTTSRFSSPGTAKIRLTPSFSGAATRRSEPLRVSVVQMPFMQPIRKPVLVTEATGAR
jgi:hypothetical protein